jgi:hypothetical protein
MAKNSNKLIWDEAVPLSDAWEQFAPKSQRKAIAKENGFVAAFAEAANSNPDQGFISALKAGSEALNTRNALIAKLQDKLQIALLQGRLCAVGYRIAPTISRAPVRIEQNLFGNAKINWHRNSIESLGRTYSEVRIFNSNDLPQSQKTKMGRPGSNDVLNNAIAAIIKSDPAFANKPRKIACNEIREFLGIEKIPGNGLSDKNLEKYIIANCGRRQIIK